jgi:hypothetical protein
VAQHTRTSGVDAAKSVMSHTRPCGSAHLHKRCGCSGITRMTSVEGDNERWLGKLQKTRCESEGRGKGMAEERGW